MFKILKKHAFGRIIVIPALFYVSIQACGLSDQAIEDLATSQFSTLPGFGIVKNSTNSGHFFEMESALYISQHSRESIIGFSLAITLLSEASFCDKDNGKINLTSSEFDVITTNFIVEAKLAGWPEHYCEPNPYESKYLNQFIKEKNFILWIEHINKKIRRGLAKISCISMKKNRPILKITTHKKRASTANEILLYCNWITSKIPQECEKQLASIFSLLAGKNLLVVFKAKICPTCKECFDSCDINYRDGVVL